MWNIIIWIIIILFVVGVFMALSEVMEYLTAVVWIFIGFCAVVIGIGYVISLFTGDEPMTVTKGIIQFLKGIVGSFFEGIREGTKSN